MKFSILYVLVIIVFAFCIFITRRAKKKQFINAAEVRSVSSLLVAFFIWTLIATAMGMAGLHLSLMEFIPLLWQPCIPVALSFVYLLFFKTLRSALRGIASGTPRHWIVFFQALRIGALGTVIKGLKGEIESGYVLWIGIPDFFFGVSAVITGLLMVRKDVGSNALIIWNFIGAAIILLPTFIPMSFWMNERGFSFIFTFPMVLAPSIVVPVFILLNILMAWNILELRRA